MSFNNNLRLVSKEFEQHHIFSFRAQGVRHNWSLFPFLFYSKFTLQYRWTLSNSRVCSRQEGRVHIFDILFTCIKFSDRSSSVSWQFSFINISLVSSIILFLYFYCLNINLSFCHCQFRMLTRPCTFVIINFMYNFGFYLEFLSSFMFSLLRVSFLVMVFNRILSCAMCGTLYDFT